MKEYSVLHWGSHPDKDNDDCYVGSDYETKEEALAEFRLDASFEIAYIEIDGPDIHDLRSNPKYSRKEIRLDDAAARSEYAMQAGMAFGCDGYNEAMGWD